MKSIIALEKLIKDIEKRIAVSKGQLLRHQSGEEKLSLLAESSAENSLDKHIPMLAKYRNLLKEFQKIEKLDSYEHRRLRAAIERKKYYKYHRESIKKIKYKENDEKIEATMIIDELPEEFILEQRELFEFSLKNIEHYLLLHPDSEADLQRIQEEFTMQIKNFTDENIKSLELLNYLIPIVIFHFHIFMLNIIDEFNDESEEASAPIDFFPKYQDWWISEIWSNENAYFAVYQWKNNITELAPTENLKKAWDIIFNNWIFVKSLLSEKSNVAYEYQYIFDSLLYQYAKLESEIDEELILNSQKELEQFIRNENLLGVMPNHHVITPYVEYKLNNTD